MTSERIEEVRELLNQRVDIVGKSGLFCSQESFAANLPMSSRQQWWEKFVNDFWLNNTNHVSGRIFNTSAQSVLGCVGSVLRIERCRSVEMGIVLKMADRACQELNEYWQSLCDGAENGGVLHPFGLNFERLGYCLGSFDWDECLESRMREFAQYFSSFLQTRHPSLISLLDWNLAYQNYVSDVQVLQSCFDRCLFHGFENMAYHLVGDLPSEWHHAVEVLVRVLKMLSAG